MHRLMKRKIIISKMNEKEFPWKHYIRTELQINARG